MNFENDIEELRKCHENNPKLIEKEFSKFVLDMKVLSSTDSKVIHEIGIHNIIMGILLFFILLVGLFHYVNFSLYFFAYIFFVAGFFIGIKVKGGGIIFLFSHGGTGLAIMVTTLLSSTNIEVLLSDFSIRKYFYFGVIAFFFLVATIMVIAHNLSDKLKLKRYYVDSILVLYFIGLLLVGIFPYMMKYL